MVSGRSLFNQMCGHHDDDDDDDGDDDGDDDDDNTYVGDAVEPPCL